MNILVTGGLGYIASHTIVELSSKSSKIHIIDNLQNSSLTIFENLKVLLPSSELILHEGDIIDSNFIEKVFLNPIDAVLHFAAVKAVGPSMKLPLEYYQTNVLGTINLLLGMKKANVKKFIFSSSACVYGGQGGSYSETDSKVPVNVYGRTKATCEQIINDYGLSDFSFEAIILRYFNPFGAHSSGLIGENPNGVPENLMPFIQKVVLGEQPCLQIFGNDYISEDGTAIRDFIHVNDIAKGHVVALENLTPGVEVYNLGTGRGSTVLQVLKTYEQISGKEIKYEFVNRREGDVNTVLADPVKANKKLNWRAELSLEEMCKDSWNFIRKK